MASVNWVKLHTVQNIKAIARHCDKDCRLIDNHENEHIDTSRTQYNSQMCDYDTFCKKLDKRMEFLDSQPRQNRKPDRVIAFSLELPIPDEIPDDKIVEFTDKVNNLISEQIGADNIMGSYVHVDEIHEYKDSATKENRTSMRHIHTIVTAAIDNHLNGKQMSSRKNLIQLNNAIHKMASQDYGAEFMNGSKLKSLDEVETLKNKSLRLENEQLESENVELRRTRKQLREDIAKTQSELAEIQSKVNQGKITHEEIQKQIQALQKQLQVLQKDQEDYLAFRAERRRKRQMQAVEMLDGFQQNPDIDFDKPK